MTAYANDPRVQSISLINDHTYRVDLPDDEPAIVYLNDQGQFTANYLSGRPFGLRRDEYATADEAIRSLIGDPR